MHFEKRSHYSGSLNREMDFNVYGHAGKPIIVFPSSGGSHNEYADFGMIDAIKDFINRGLIKVYTPNSVDSESWFAENKSAHDMAYFHNLYDSYIINEFIPLIRHESNWDGNLIATGCSMGGFHTVNFALRHPDVFDTAIALSGVYDARFFTGEYYGDLEVYHNSPLDYLSNTDDFYKLENYRHNDYIVCVGQGAWEDPHISDTKKLEQVFKNKNIPGWFDYWGYDVEHDWPWWQKQMPYFLSTLESQGKI